MSSGTSPSPSIRKCPPPPRVPSTINHKAIHHLITIFFFTGIQSCTFWKCLSVTRTDDTPWHTSGGLWGGRNRLAPLNIWSTMFVILFCFKMLKAQRARESITPPPPRTSRAHKKALHGVLPWVPKYFDVKGSEWKEYTTSIVSVNQWRIKDSKQGTIA